ncbi:MAG TPA: PP2C family protein-serine/threonine phosphatase [Nocardioidaceae bacterium]|nr:PP2C family protein-serine/threonine phosphatase [Nocardioidaceae bacterium]
MGTSSWAGARDLTVPAIVLAAMVVADYLLPPTMIIIGAFEVAVFAACVLAAPRWTALLAVVATSMAAVSATWNQNLGTADWWIRVATTAILGALAVVLSMVRVRRERDLQRMTVIAEYVERAILRPMPPSLRSIRLAAGYRSATTEALVGGDLYEVLDTPHGVRIIVGDVCGKGLEAVHLTLTVVAAFRRAAFAEANLADIARNLDASVATVATDEDFVTAVLGEFHDDHTISWVNCGHHSPLLLSSTDKHRLVDTGEPQPPLGLHPTPVVANACWSKGDRILLYTDGLVEARDARGEFFPFNGTIESLRSGDPDEALKQLLSHLDKHAGGRLSDDVAVVLAENPSG